MSRKDSSGPGPLSRDRPGSPGGGDDADVKAGGWQQKDREVRWSEFPAAGAHEVFRVTFSRQAYADLIEHAKQDLDAEVCGVLAGEFREDDAGMYVAVEAAVKGTSVGRGTAHVTYTQETWNQIHRTMESDYPKLQIVGWYHSHPGFGVEFSDMDMFIQENFFAAAGQVAFVTDPLGGSEALCAKVGSRVEHLSKFWVDGRERRCFLPAGSGGQGQGQSAAVGELAAAVHKLEDRLNQTLKAMEDSRRTAYGFMTFVGMVVATAAVFWVGLNIWQYYTAGSTPPKIEAFSQVPAKVNGQWCWVGAQVIPIPLPPEAQKALVEQELKDLRAAEEAAKKAASRPAAPGATSVPAGGAKPSPATNRWAPKP